LKVLITGGAGFIGSHTAQALRARNHAVTILDNFSEQVHTDDRSKSSTWNAIRDIVELVEGDVRDCDLLDALVPGFEVVLHLAAETGTGQSMYDVARYCDVNILGTANLLWLHHALFMEKDATFALVTVQSFRVRAVLKIWSDSTSSRSARSVAGQLRPFQLMSLRCPSLPQSMLSLN
jgi:UDP-glucose 4-epimerase